VTGAKWIPTSAETSDGGTSREDDDGPTAAVIPTTDGPALVDLMRMSEDEWDAYTRGSAMRRAGYAGLRRNVAIVLGNWRRPVGGRGATAQGRRTHALGAGAIGTEHPSAARFLAATDRPRE